MKQESTSCEFAANAASEEDCCLGHRSQANTLTAYEDNESNSELCICLCEGYGKVCPCAKRIAHRRAMQAIQELYKNSDLFFPGGAPEKTMMSSLHVFRPDQLLIGEQLGRGGFCQVHHVIITCNGPEVGCARERNAPPHFDPNHDNDFSNQKKHPYAIKFLKLQAMVDKKRLLQGAADLAVEVNFLAALGNEVVHGSHNKHIIKLHGVAQGQILREDGGFEDRPLFLIMDELVETLDHRVHKTWKDEEKVYHGLFSGLAIVSHDFQRRRLDALLQRLKVALEVAYALRFLHSLHVVYRDLKPENFGFDHDGVGKLYDFGLATELKYPLKGGKYCLSGAGSIRYMAPEVELGGPYDLSVDVYSYGLLLYEVATLKKPFEGFDANMHMHHVVKCGGRPHIPHWLPKHLQALIMACWSTQSDNRPSFSEIVAKMEKLVQGQAKESSPRLIDIPHESSGSVPLEL